MVNNNKFVTVIVPCREEERYIGQTITSIMANDYPHDRLEVLVIDGMSTDRTRQLVREFQEQYPFLKLLDNPKKITPAALNIGIAQAKGDIILRVDAHGVIPPLYISSLVGWLEKTGADNVGGVLINLPGSVTPKAKAIALALSHPFGVGNAYFRIGTQSPRWVDTVPYGCFRRELFSRVGLFDEDHVRSEDDEFNLRLKKQGGRLLLVPEIAVHYYTRDSLSKIWRMYYQYGYFKALVARKLGAVLKLRHIIPSLFLLTLLTLFLLGGAVAPLRTFALLLSLAYGLADIYFALSTARRAGAGGAVAFWLALVFPTLHLSYGLGFLKGLVDFFLLKKKGVPDAAGIPLSR
jgi:cellulose synthase/poly-beta-1,6-N-acetylglucosamine synthase-like glycosyltransferase